ncbi:hypothetical protein D3C76_1234640 [compost metagenome]
MRLDNVELNALRRLFCSEPFMSMVNVDEISCVVVERALTVAGFYSVIQFDVAHDGSKPFIEISKKFKHPLLKKGGVYVCWVNRDLTLCLEGFSSESGWPKDLTPSSLQ